MSDRSDSLRQYETFTATIAPKDLDTLKPSAEPLVGQRFSFRAEWIIEDDEPYAGDWACTIQDPPNRDLDWVWLPSRDLDDIELFADPESRKEAS